MGWILNSDRSWFDGAEGELGVEVSFGEVAMEKQSIWNDFVNLRELLGNAENEITTKT